MNFYSWSCLLIFCLIWLAVSENSNITEMRLSITLNGHYITWPSKCAEMKFVNEKRYIPKNIIYTRFQMCSDRVFLVAPRFRSGVPFTLGFTWLTDKNSCYNYVMPFPCLEKQNTGPSCNVDGLVNAIDVVMGENGILWILDTGISETLSDHPSKACEPKVFGIDASTAKILYTISLKSLNCGQSRLQHLLVEKVSETSTVLYVSDGGMRSIIVWNVQSNEGYRVKLTNVATHGCIDNPREDVFYMALIEQDTGNYIYFSYLSSQDMFRVKTRDLRKRINPKCFVNMGKKPCKMVFVGVGYGTVLYFRVRGENHLYSWDTKQTFLEENFMIVRRAKDCRQITHVDVDNNGVLWVLESNIQDFITGKVGCYGPSILLSSVYDTPTPANNDCDPKNSIPD